MSKVKRLRKKYRALCSNANKSSNVKNVNSSVDQQSRINLKAEKNEQKSEVNALYDMIMKTNECRGSDMDLKSNYSISKSIKSNFSGQSILKKDKQRLKHELFIKKLESSAEVMKQLKKSKHRSSRKIDLNDALPSLPVNDKKTNNSFKFPSKDSKISKNRHTGKGLNKRRNAQMMKDIEQFQTLLHKNSEKKNQFDEIQRRIVDRLSEESLQSLNTSSS